VATLSVIDALLRVRPLRTVTLPACGMVRLEATVTPSSELPGLLPQSNSSVAPPLVLIVPPLIVPP
jgi:hypothetical protein